VFSEEVSQRTDGNGPKAMGAIREVMLGLTGYALKTGSCTISVERK